MFKRANVVMFPTNEKASYPEIWLMHNKAQLLMHLKTATGLDGVGQHIYILSNEEPREDDWCLNISKGIIYKKNRLPMDMMWKKIIATTDKYLELVQPSNSFIQKYIEEYNKGNIITDILVEYESKNISDNEGFFNLQNVLKVNPKDNTITIKKIKDSWNREEIVNLLFNLAEHYAMTSSKSEIEDFNENL